MNKKFKADRVDENTVVIEGGLEIGVAYIEHTDVHVENAVVGVDKTVKMLNEQKTQKKKFDYSEDALRKLANEKQMTCKDGIYYREFEDRMEVIVTENSWYQTDTWLRDIVQSVPASKTLEVMGTARKGIHFIGCRAWRIDLSKLDTSRVTNMSRMFYECESQFIDMSSFDTSNVEYMVEMFAYSNSGWLDLSSLDTSNVVNMAGMFRESKAPELDLRSFNTSKVSNMSYMFEASDALKIDTSSFDTSNVTDMSCMFHEARVKRLVLRNFDTSNVITMREMFRGLQLDVLDVCSFDTSNVQNMNYMFALTEVPFLDLTGFKTGNVREMRGMFWKTKITGKRIKTSEKKVHNMFENIDKVQGIELDLPNTFNTKDVVSMADMFGGPARSVHFGTTILLGGFDTSNVEMMEEMFKEIELDYLDLSHFNTASVLNMSSMFEGSKIKELNISNFTVDRCEILQDMFANFKAESVLDLTKFKIKPFEVGRVCDMFNNCRVQKVICTDIKLAEYARDSGVMVSIASISREGNIVIKQNSDDDSDENSRVLGKLKKAAKSFWDKL